MLPNKGPVGVPTFSAESSLPKFPLPEIDDTLERYKRAALPFCKSQDEVRRLDEQLAQAQPQLEPIQKLLRERHAHKDNYVHGEWWTKYGYLEDRSAITPIESYQLHYGREYLAQLGSEKKIPIERQAAAMAINLARFHTELVNESLAVKGFSSKEPITMNQYRSLFECCRVPKPTFDAQLYHFKTRGDGRLSRPRYFVLGSRGRLYKILVDDPVSLQLVSVDRLVTAISQAGKSSMDEYGPSEFHSVGFFTGSNRDWWTEARQLLIESDRMNEITLDTVERSLFFLSWDCAQPLTDEEHLRKLSISPDGGSRWYDKSSQLVMFSNGKCGFSMEHSVMDVASSFAMHEWCEREFVNVLNSKSKHTGSSSALVEFLGWANVPNRVKQLWSEAKNEYLIRATSGWNLKTTRMHGIGRRWLRNQMGVSPDSFFQMAFHDTYYRLHGKLPSTYESVGVLRFRLGRTETGRCASIESKDFVETCSKIVKGDQLPDDKQLQEIGGKLRTACRYHQQWIKDASEGKGFDRHLFAIRCICRETGLTVPAFLNDPLFARATKWDLSTSNAYMEGTLQQWSGGTSFRPVGDDSVGVVYAIGEHHVDLTVMNVDPAYDATVFLNTLGARVALLCKALQVTLPSASSKGASL